MRDRSGNYLAVIKVVGVGGGGTNAVNRMVDAGLTGVEFVAVNTDAQALLMCDADVKIHIGKRRRSPRHQAQAHGIPPVGHAGAMESRDEATAPEAHQGAAAWCSSRPAEGGGTRHRRRACRRRAGASELEQRCTVGVVTRPFSFEGAPPAGSRPRTGHQRACSKREVDTLIVIANDRLLQSGAEQCAPPLITTPYKVGGRHPAARACRASPTTIAGARGSSAWTSPTCARS